MRGTYNGIEVLSGGYGEFLQKVYKAYVRPLEGHPPPFVAVGFTSEFRTLGLGSGALGLKLQVPNNSRGIQGFGN